ncbi:MAG: hypothetical protein ACOCVZ_08455 [Gemmatimonadota bacterium]
MSTVTKAPAIAPGLAARTAPPFRLPGEHFAAGMLFLLAGALGLVWVAPELAAGWYPSSRVVGVAHLFTLGWITLSIWGALYQFLPVALGEPIRWQGLAHVSFAVFVPGLVGFVAGLLGGHAWVMLVGAAAFGTGVLLFVVNLVATLARSSNRDLTWWTLVAAAVYLLITLLLGLALTGNLRWGFLGVARWTALGVHMHVALGGWVLMVMIGVAHRLLPMFLLSHGASERWGKAAGVLVALGVAWLALFHHAGSALAHWVPAALIGVGLLSFLVQARLFYVRRVKRQLDAGLRLAAAGLVILGLGLVLGGVMLTTDLAPARVATTYGAALVLGPSVFVAAHYYKIVPFLVWFHRYGPRVSEGPVPRVSELYSGRAATVAGSLLAAGVLGLLVAMLAGSGDWARAAAVVAGIGVVVETIQMGRLGWKKP